MYAAKSARRINQSAAAGVTLMELLITLAILGILAAIMVPAYSGQLNKSRRTDAKIALADAVKNLERCYVNHNKYNHADCPSFPASGAEMVLSDDGHYKIVATALSDTSYTLTASPVASKPQINDSYCQKFIINSTGAKSATNADCW